MIFKAALFPFMKIALHGFAIYFSSPRIVLIFLNRFHNQHSCFFLIKLLPFFKGWASAEFLTTKLIPLWVGAKGIEFDWKYTQMSLDSNISLVSSHFIITSVDAISLSDNFL